MVTARTGFNWLRRISKCPTLVRSAVQTLAYPKLYVVQSDMTQTNFKKIRARVLKDTNMLDRENYPKAG
jgi:hypothetical protein